MPTTEPAQNQPTEEQKQTVDRIAEAYVDCGWTKAYAIYFEAQAAAEARAVSDATKELRAEVERLKTLRILGADSLKSPTDIYEVIDREKLASITTKLALAERDSRRLDWLDYHCAFVADSEFKIGPYKVGELRKMADDGIAQSPAMQPEGGK